MAQTTTSDISAAVTFKVQRNVLANLRATLTWADRSLAAEGDFDAGHDVLTFVNVPDLAINVTALTEGTPRTPSKLTIGVTNVSAVQYGDLVAITDLAKVKAPFQIVDIASERVSRQARESLDQVARDIIAAGGTAFYADAVANRAALGAGNKMTAANLRRLRAKMFKSKIPVPADGYYKLFIHPDVGYDLRNDGATAGSWIDVNKYATPENIMRGELGRMEGFRIAEVVNAPTFASTVTVYASIAVGDLKGWGAGDLQTLQTYHVAPGGDHKDPLAQEELVGWKVAYGTAVLSNSYYFRAESAATLV